MYFCGVRLPQHVRAEKRALEARRGVLFSAEIPIRMRIDMRIRHGNANRGRSATGRHPRGRLQFFPPFLFPPRLDCDRRAVGSEHERSELFGETTKGLSKLVDAYRRSGCRVLVSFDVRPFIFQLVDKFIRSARSVGEERGRRDDESGRSYRTLFPSLSQSELKSFQSSRGN